MEFYDQKRNENEWIRDRESVPFGLIRGGRSGFVEQLLRIKAEENREESGSLLNPETMERITRCFSLSETEQKLLTTFASLQLSGDARTDEILESLTLLEGDLPAAFLPNAPLLKYRLLESEEKETISDGYRIPQKLLFQLSGYRSMDAKILSSTRSLPDDRIIAESGDGTVQSIQEALSTYRASGKAPLLIELEGRVSGEILSVVSLALERSNLRGRIIKNEIMLIPEKREGFLSLWNRDAKLDGLVAVVELAGKMGRGSRERILSFVREMEGAVILVGTEPLENRSMETLRLVLPDSGYADQERLWRDAFESVTNRETGAVRIRDEEKDEEIRFLTNRYRLTPAQIRGCVLTAFSGEKENKETDMQTLRSNLRHEARIRARPRIDDLARLIEPGVGLEDLVVEENHMRKIKEMITRLNHQRTVLYDHGFENKLSRGLGITALFAGKSGTGKTHASEAIAKEVGLDLYRIDLSRVVSKYIGETEKNLRRIFDGAASGGAVLLFDEADALFGKRSEVKDSHDRYANMEIAFLLQKMEEYRGLSILTTNLNESMDDAFRRRISYQILFKFPDEAARKRIWERIFPERLPTHNLNFDELARVEVSGGEIKNMALRAAFLAAEEGEPLKMKHIFHTINDELLKSGSHPVAGQFQHWTRDEMN